MTKAQAKSISYSREYILSKNKQETDDFSISISTLSDKSTEGSRIDSGCSIRKQPVYVHPKKQAHRVKQMPKNPEKTTENNENPEKAIQNGQPAKNTQVLLK